jgi:hypothetical protein
MSDTDTTIQPALGTGRAGGYEWENRQAVRTVYDGPPLRSLEQAWARQWQIRDRLVERPVAEREYERYCAMGMRDAYFDVLAMEARYAMDHDLSARAHRAAVFAAN